ncbi:MAG: cupredoxin domain-containing protein [Actinobacteria bacterium]|nr:cupredoxin domain-containing protein [Actinomycetota bacterium]
MPSRSTRSRLSSRVLAVLVLTAAMTTAAQAATSSAPPGRTVSGQPAAATVDATDQLQFEPMTVQVSRGDVVEWTSTGSIPHNVTFDQYPGMTSGTMSRGDRHEVRFMASGSYPYRCTFHPGMNGTVTVR